VQPGDEGGSRGRCLAELESQGVRFYRFGPGFMHQKVILVDDGAAVGTADFDHRSFRLNFEITVIADDDGFAAEVERMLAADFESSRPMKLDDLHRKGLFFRFTVQLARLMSPIQ